MTTVMTIDEVPAESREHDRLKGVAEILAVGLQRWRDKCGVLCPVTDVKERVVMPTDHASRPADR